MKKAILLVIAMALLAACDRTKIAPRLDTAIQVQRTGPTAVLIKAHVKNLRNRGTVPLDVEVTAEPKEPSGWGSPVRVIHPAPFVLNDKEARDLTTTLVTTTGVRATLIVKEAERGWLVVTKTAQAE
ncbi:MAG: hypothetical protein ABSB67_19060 [Bryobacteraceae bacterium]|jgi:hypothetical protein